MKEGRKVRLITGSSRGFGAELVTAVLESGDAVLATARHPEDITQPSDKHRERFRKGPLDVTDPGAAEAAVALAQADLGGLDVVVNNAGYANSASIEEMDPQDFKAQIEANLFGVVNVTRAALPVLRAQRSGTFVQFSSLVVELDVTAAGERESAVKAGHDHFGSIDVLVNSAGADFWGAIEEQNEADYRTTFDVNLFGAVELIRLVLPEMRLQQGGTIVNISSLRGIVSVGGNGYYCSTGHTPALLSVSEGVSVSEDRHASEVPHAL